GDHILVMSGSLQFKGVVKPFLEPVAHGVSEGQPKRLFLRYFFEKAGWVTEGHGASRARLSGHVTTIEHDSTPDLWRNVWCASPATSKLSPEKSQLGKLIISAMDNFVGKLVSLNLFEASKNRIFRRPFTSYGGELPIGVIERGD